VILVPREAQALAESGIALEDRQGCLIELEADWLQSPIRDVCSLFHDLTQPARAKVVALLLTTAPPLFRVGDRPDYAVAATDALAAACLPVQPVRSAVVLGDGVLLSVRLDRLIEGATSIAAVSRHRLGSLSGVSTLVADGAAEPELHVCLPRRLSSGSRLVVLDRSGQGLVVEPPQRTTQDVETWISSAPAAARLWARNLLVAAERDAPAPARSKKDGRRPWIDTIAPVEVFATPTGVLVAGRIPATASTARSLTIQRGATSTAIDLPGAGSADPHAKRARGFCLFARYAGEERGTGGVKLSLSDRIGNVLATGLREPSHFDAHVSETLASALRRFQPSLDEEQVARACAEARAGLTYAEPDAEVVAIGDGGDAALSIVAPLPENPDIVKARAAAFLNGSEPLEVDFIYFCTNTESNESRVRLLEDAHAIYGQNYRLVVTDTSATPSAQIQRAVAEASDSALLLGAGAVPDAPGILELFREALCDFPTVGVFGGVILSPHGAPLDTGGRLALREDAPDVESEHHGRRLSDDEPPAHATTDLASAAAVLLRKAACAVLREIKPVYARPDHLITEVIARLERRGVGAHTILAARFIDFTPATRRDPLDEKVDRILLGAALRRAPDALGIAAE
jgi:hypothetical protein